MNFLRQKAFTSTSQPTRSPSPAAKSQQKGFPEGHPNPAALLDSGGSLLHRLLQDVVEEPFGVAVLRSPFRTERRPLLYLSEGREQHAVQFPRAGSFHLGFDDELVAFFRGRAFRGELVESLPDRLGVRAVDACLELEFHLDHPSITASSGIVVARPTAMTLGTIPSRDPWENESPHMNAAIPER